MISRWISMVALGVAASLTACGTLVQAPVSSSVPPASVAPPLPPVPPPATSMAEQARSAGGYSVLDQRTYFHQHYGPNEFSAADNVYVWNSRAWINFTTPDQWASISGYVYGSLGTYGPKSWYYIHSPYQGWIWWWNGSQWVRKNAGYFGQALAYVN